MNCNYSRSAVESGYPAGRKLLTVGMATSGGDRYAAETAAPTAQR
ncbi:MAG: hypothetical protein ACLQAT_28000 [Candidatus Binataceae bacterium]